MNAAAHRSSTLLLPLAVLLTTTLCCTTSREPVAGRWNAWLDSPGGRLDFSLELDRIEGDEGSIWGATLINGDERRPVTRVDFVDGELSLDFASYGSSIAARLDDEGNLHGLWRRKSGPDRFDELPFHAEPGPPPSLPGGGEVSVAGRWRVDFDGDEVDAVGIFEGGGDRPLTGTFRTATGDYRFLGGSFDGDEGLLRLSVFDGAHAFLFVARLRDDGTLAGDFWSRATWHQTWTAARDEEYELPDPFEMTRWVAGMELGEATFPDLDGNLHSLDEPAFQGAARIVEIFGSWCPNCDDATRFLVELDQRFHHRGLRILGLAFEMTGDPDEDGAQLRTYIAEHGIPYPVLLAGTSDKQQASEAFPWIDRVRAFPTFIFLDGRNRVEAIYTGFDGPATGPAHDRLRERFELLIEELLDAYDPAGRDVPRWM